MVSIALPSIHSKELQSTPFPWSEIFRWGLGTSNLRILISDLSLALSNLLCSGESGKTVGDVGFGFVAAAMTRIALPGPIIEFTRTLKQEALHAHRDCLQGKCKR